MKLHIVPARTGAEWVKLGLRTFWRQPLAFVSLFFLFMAAISIVSQVPLPAALPLLASGIAALGFAGWRKKRHGAAKAA